MDRDFKQEEKNNGVLRLSFTAEEFSNALDEAFKRNAGNFEIQGFRKGKAPKQVVLAHYGEGILYDDAISYLVNPAYIEAIEELDITPVSQPELNVEKIGSKEGLEVVLSFDTEPEAKLGEYKGVKAVRPKDTVDEEDIENEIKRVQERNARLVPVEDEAAKEGDTVNIDFEGFKDGEAFDGGKGEGHDLELGSNSFIPGFEDQLVGAKAGDDVKVNVTFPEEYHAEELAGAEAVFEVKVNSIKRKELPELDDDFAMDISEYDTFAEYKDSVGEELAEKIKEYSDREFENNVLKKVADNIEVEIPQSMLEHEVDHILEYQERQLQQQGLSLELYLQFMGQDIEEFKKSIYPVAEDQIKTRLALKAVIKEENLEVEDADLEAELEALAESTKLTVEQVKERIDMNPSTQKAFERDALTNKAVKFLVENAEAISPEEAEELLDVKVDANADAAKDAEDAE